MLFATTPRERAALAVLTVAGGLVCLIAAAGL